MKNPPLKDYIYVNQLLAERLGDQIQSTHKRDETRDREFSINLKVATAKHKKSAQTKVSDPASSAYIDAIRNALADSGQLHMYRPDNYSDYFFSTCKGWYVLETITATPVLIPTGEEFRDIGGPEYLTVWVDEPSETSQLDDQPEFSGSFLFLVQESWDGRRNRMISGVSSLRLIAEGIANGEGLDAIRCSSELDRYGRDSHLHPLDKLNQVGGKRLRRRSVEVLYKICYMTNEQAYFRNGTRLRVNDIFAYPLYIAE